MPTMTPAGVEFVDTAPFKIRTELRLSHPPQAVWDVIADNESKSLEVVSEIIPLMSDMEAVLGDLEKMEFEILNVPYRELPAIEPEHKDVDSPA